MAHLLFGKDDILLKWAAAKIDSVKTPENFGPARAIGVATGDQKTDTLMAVVVFHGYQPQFKLCELSVASVNPRWASKDTLRQILAVPFIQYDCNKVSAVIPHTSDRVIRFVKAIGFVQEATLRDGFGPATHAIVCRMMAKDYDRKYLDQVKTGLDRAKQSYQFEAAE